MLKTDSRKRSAVGRISRDDGDARLRPFNRPPTTRIGSSFVLRLEVALAVIAALRTAWRAVAVGLGFVAGARLFAARALYQHAAALAVGDQAALAGRLERLSAARGVRSLVFGQPAGIARHLPVEIRACKRGDLFTELFP